MNTQRIRHRIRAIVIAPVLLPVLILGSIVVAAGAVIEHLSEKRYEQR